MDSSSFSSPLESPDAPITSSVVTLQSAESLSFRRQVRLCSGHCSEPVDNSCLPAHIFPELERYSSLPSNTHTSLTKTPDTPSANISSQSPSEQSQAFTSRFTSEASLLPKLPDEPQSPSAILTPSSEVSSSDADAHNSEDIDFLKFDEDPWDITNFDYDLSCISIDELSTKSCQSD